MSSLPRNPPILNKRVYQPTMWALDSCLMSGNAAGHKLPILWDGLIQDEEAINQKNSQKNRKNKGFPTNLTTK